MAKRSGEEKRLHVLSDLTISKVSGCRLYKGQQEIEKDGDRATNREDCHKYST